MREALKAFLRATDRDIPLVSDVIIGRDEAPGTISVPDPGISKRHCRLFIVDRSWYVEDLRSDNGTFLNDRLVLSRRKLVDGDVLRLGPAQQPLWTASFAMDLPVEPPAAALVAIPPAPAHECEAPELRRLLDSSQTRGDTFERELGEAQRALQALRESHDGEIEQHRTTRLRVRELEDALALAGEDLAILRKKLEQLDESDELHHARVEIEAVRQRCRTLEAEREHATAQAQAAMAEHASLRNDLEQALELAEERRNELEALRSERELLRTELEALRSNLANPRKL